jgi:hypothetical protein
MVSWNSPMKKTPKSEADFGVLKKSDRIRTGV